MKKLLVFVFLFLFASSAWAEPYVVKSGDNLYSISKRYKVSLTEIKRANNLKSNSLKPGMRLNIPSDNKIAKKVSTKRSKNALSQKKEDKSFYIVKKGDTLRKIALRHKTTAEELMRINGLESSNLSIGQRILLKETQEQAPEEPLLTEATIKETLENGIGNSPNMDIKERLRLVAEMMMDIPYRFGGSSLKGMDCSAYVQKVFSFVNIFLPRAAREQFNVGIPITKDELSLGDLVFFRTYAKFPSHVGIYLRDNLFIHASSVDKKVTIGRLDAPYYAKRFIGARRLIQDTETQSEDNL